MGDVDTGLFLGRIPYIKAGSGRRRAVVFFGGNALFKRLDRSDASRYAAMFSRLLPADYSFCILGYEENPPETYSLDTIVDDLDRIARTEIGRSTVIGVSFGAFVAIRFAAAQPELVDKLVILVGAHRFSAQGARKIAKQIAHLKVRNLYGLVRENGVLFRRPWYNWLVRLKLWRDKDKLASEFNEPTYIARAYESLFGADFERNREYADRIRAKTLIIGGSADQYFDVAAFEETARRIPVARLELFDGETHMLPVERRRDVARVLAEFLTTEDAAWSEV
jgi:pimeloyl-ACP methyl ester carboxylesterase